MDRPDNRSPGPVGDRDRVPPQKSADAYRTIGEVADELKLPQHVLRFWETRFPHLKPLKRAGGRRFYRPEDVALLRAVQALLYGEGYTIKGVQRLFAEYGAGQVAEALARSAQAPVEGECWPPGSNPDERIVTDMSGDGSPGRRDPAPVFPRPAPPPAQPLVERPAPTRSDRLMDAAVRLESVLAELVECERMLSALRSTRN